MNANDRQVGGKHYASQFQHWDLVRIAEMPYMEAQVARYVSRHGKKDGAEGLRKADHFLQKMEERRTQILEEIIPAYVRANRLGVTEQFILNKLITGDYGEARAGIASLLSTEYGAPSREYVDQD